MTRDGGVEDRCETKGGGWLVIRGVKADTSVSLLGFFITPWDIPIWNHSDHATISIFRITLFSSGMAFLGTSVSSALGNCVQIFTPYS